MRQMVGTGKNEIKMWEWVNDIGFWPLAEITALAESRRPLPRSVLQREPVGAKLGLSGLSGRRRFSPRFLARGTLILSVAFSVKLLYRETSIRRVNP